MYCQASADAPLSVTPRALPKGPFRTKNAIAMEIVVFCYRRCILLSLPICCRFSPGKNSIQITIAVVNYYGSSKLLAP